jgi:hypothetical protein
MTLSYGVFYTLVTICSIIVVVLLFFLLHKWLSRQREQVVSLIGSLVLGTGVLAFYLLKSCYTPVVEVRGYEKEEYVLVAGSSFTASDEQEVVFKRGEEGAIVINITDQTMFVERIEYSIGGFINLSDNDGVQEVPPHSFTVLSKEPDFYPWDGTPDEITVSAPAMYATKIRVYF